MWLGLLLSGCGPVYETHYVPPLDAAGKNCSFNCENNRQICRQACKVEYDVCLREARMDAHEDYLREKERYLDKKAQCPRDTRKGDRKDDRKNDQEESRQDTRKNEDDCERRSELGKEPCRNYDKKTAKKDNKKDTQKDTQKHDKDCSRLSEPSMNTYAYDHRCDSYCGCDDDFNRCFQLCGGKVIRRCVEGCQ